MVDYRKEKKHTSDGPLTKLADKKDRSHPYGTSSWDRFPAALAQQGQLHGPEPTAPPLTAGPLSSCISPPSGVAARAQARPRRSCASSWRLRAAKPDVVHHDVLLLELVPERFGVEISGSNNLRFG